jgi:hypothetical protein
MTTPRFRRSKLTAARVRELLDCDPSTGTLRWKERPDCPAFKFAGRRAGTFDRTTGYRRVMIDGRYYYEHVIVWVHSRGYWPPRQVDHKSGDRCANWIDNLRPATSSQQTQTRNATQTRRTRSRAAGRTRPGDGAQRSCIRAGQFGSVAMPRWLKPRPLAGRLKRTCLIRHFGGSSRPSGRPTAIGGPQHERASRPGIPSVRSDRSHPGGAATAALPQRLTSGLQCYRWALQHQWASHR